MILRTGYTQPVFYPQDLRFCARQFLSFAVALLMATSYASGAQQPFVPKQSRQLLVVTTPTWNSVTGTVRRYERLSPGDPWRKVGGLIAVVVGKNGMGWGDGIVAVSQHAGNDPMKHEGDGRTPAGVFSIGSTFGYAQNKPAAWKMTYRTLTPATECVDDRDSKYYNQIIERTGVTPDWKSSEHMRSEGLVYEWGAVVEQNPEDRSGEGSCVFLHVSDSNGQGTAGCTAMAKPELETILGWLKPSEVPLIVEMPITEYKQAAKALRLPTQ